MATVRLRDLGKVKDAFLIPLSKLIPGSSIGDNVREDFSCVPERANSLILDGQLEPIEVRMADDKEHAIITDGECRYRGALYANETLDAGIEALWCVAEKTGTTASERMFRQINHNQQRANLKPVELAKSFRRLIDEHSISVVDIAKRLDKTDQWVYDHLRLLNAPEEIKRAVETERISKTAAVKASRGTEEQKKAITEKIESGAKVTVKEVEITQKGRMSQIPASHIDNLIKFCIEKVKSSEEHESHNWEFGIIILRCALGIEKIDKI